MPVTTRSVFLSIIVSLSAFVEVWSRDRNRHGVDANLGWQTVGEATLPEHAWRQDPKCTIDVLDEAAWQTRFMDEYYLHKPAILRGWNSFEVQTLQRKLDRRVLLESVGESDVRLATFYELTTKGHGSTVVPLREYVENLWGQQYFFDDGGIMQHIMDGNDNWKVPYGLNETGLFTGSRVLAMGANGQGIPFHWHQNAYNVLLHGRKRWAIYAPNKMTPTGVMSRESFVTWLLNRRHGVDFVPPTWECMQEPGDVFYVPEGFFHATACVGDAVGIAHLADNPTEFSAFGLYRQAEEVMSRDASDSSLRNSLSLAKRAVALDPTNALLWMFIADMYGGSGRIQKAMKCIRKALKLNPVLIDAHHALLYGLQQLGEEQKARKHQAHMIKLGIDIGHTGPGGDVDVDLSNIPAGLAV